jgi:acetyltransferase-like isoleucine patch superfamily enzyme
MKKAYIASEDPLYWLARGWRKLHSLRLGLTYPFASFGRRVSIHPSCYLRRSIAPYIQIGDGVIFEKDVRIDVPIPPLHTDPAIVIEEGSGFGQRASVLAINHIHIERNCIFAPSVLITDHSHGFEDVTLPIKDQGGTREGTVHIEQGCWVGYGAAIVSTDGKLVIGRNSVVAANSFVTRSIPPYSVATGNPARVVKQFDFTQRKWVLGRIPENRTVEQTTTS